jgi:hypothetical protein
MVTRRTAYRNSYYRRYGDANLEQWLARQLERQPPDRRDSGLWPGDIAGDVVAGAIGTAGAIATAPFRSDSCA